MDKNTSEPLMEFEEQEKKLAELHKKDAGNRVIDMIAVSAAAQELQEHEAMKNFKSHDDADDKLLEANTSYMHQDRGQLLEDYGLGNRKG